MEEVDAARGVNAEGVKAEEAEMRRANTEEVRSFIFFPYFFKHDGVNERFDYVTVIVVYSFI